jgi:soluble lytic murein transglycosylase
MLMASLLASGGAIAQPGESVAPLTNADQTFLALREAARMNDSAKAAILGAQLADYPVPSYVAYYVLKPQLFDSANHAQLDAPDAPIQDFLQRYAGLAIADRLRNDYLLVLGARHDWSRFDDQYRQFVLNDDTQVKCYALQSRAMRGENVANAARALLVDPKNYGDGCVDLIGVLTQKKQFSQEDGWRQIRLAYEQNYVGVGNRIADALGDEWPRAELFRQAAAGSLIRTSQDVPEGQLQQLNALALVRMARNDPERAAAALPQVALTSAQRAQVWGSIAYLAALNQLPSAQMWYHYAGSAALSNPASEWRARTALRAGDWKGVRTAIAALPDSLRSDPAWIYWNARALREAGQTGAAQSGFTQIADQFNFYGQLANEELGRKITVPAPAPIPDAQVAAVANLPGFQLAQRFYAMGMRFEGNREWNWTLRPMSDAQLLASAEYARRIGLYDRTVNTADRTKTEHDFALRYLAPFYPIVQREAVRTGLDIEWAYGLMRQESRFASNARSVVGASGLMQLMPGTAKLVAKKIGLSLPRSGQAHSIETNIALGSYYLADLDQRFDNSLVLASAGYNAGPNRAQKWRAALPYPVEGAIFAETIPFSETRDYVKNVLSNTTYYAVLFEGRPQSLKARLGSIAP